MTNTDQHAFWSGPSGAAWVNFQTEMDIMLQPVTDLILDAAALPVGARVLDVGCGTGASVLCAVERVGPGGHVTGLDISDIMLDHARTRVQHMSNAAILKADAQTHAFAPASFDAVISRFGVMFFDDTTAAFANIARGLMPGATLTCAAWGSPAHNPYFMEAAQAVKDVLGPMEKMDRTLPGPFALEDAARILPMLRAAGLQDARCTPVDLHLTPNGNPDTVADLLCQIGAAKRGIAHFEAGPDQRAALRAAIAGRLERFQTPQGIRIPALINLYQARVAA